MLRLGSEMSSKDLCVKSLLPSLGLSGGCSKIFHELLFTDLTGSDWRCRKDK
jgi:hypothetical protein